MKVHDDMVLARYEANRNDIAEEYQVYTNMTTKANSSNCVTFKVTCSTKSNF